VPDVRRSRTYWRQMRIHRPRLFTLVSFLSLCFCIAFTVLWISSRRITIAAKPSTADMQSMLARRIGAVNFNNVARSDAIDFVRDVTGRPFEVDWKSLEAAGIERDTPCSINIINKTIGETLVLVLSSPTQSPQFTADGPTSRIWAKGAPWNPSSAQLRPDPNRPDPIREFELKRRGNKPLPAPPTPLSERIINGRRYTLVLDRGALRLWSTPPDPAAVYQQADPIGNATDPLDTNVVELLGISIRHGGSPFNTWAVALPFWFLIVIASICPLLWLRKTRRLRGRLRRQQCPHCGYDLRATPDICPECGRPSPT
jgi:hypothetical protein